MRELDVLVIGIKDKRRRGDEAVFHGRTVYCDGLDGRAGRPCGLSGSVQTEAYGLLAGAAAQRLYLAGVLVDDDDAALKLGIGAVAGLGKSVKIGVDRVDLCLYIHVDAGVDLVARVVDQASGGLSADALGLGKVAYNVRDNDLLVVGVGRCAGGLILSADEVELLGLCLLVLALVQVSLLIHLSQDILLTLLVVLNAVEGVIVGREVGDADDGSSLRDGKILGILAEIGLCGGLNAVAALTEVHGVEVPLKDLLLVVAFLEVQRLENLQQLALHGDIILLGQVFYELLRDGRAAENRAAGEHIQRGVGRAEPVDAIMLIKPLVLNSDKCVLHVLGDLIAVDPDSVLRIVKGRQLLPISVCVLVIDSTGLIESKVVQIQIKSGGDAGLDIESENTDKQKTRNNADEKNSPDYPHGAAEFAAMGLGIRIPCDIHYSAHLLCCCVCQKLKNMIICNGHS